MEPDFEHDMRDAFLRRGLSAVMNNCEECVHRFPTLGEEEEWQNGHVERVIGSTRRKTLDHLIMFDEAVASRSEELRRLLHKVRTHSCCARIRRRFGAR
jgi:hypothetical protein